MARRRESSDYTTADKAAQYDNLMPLLDSMFHEFQDLSKKKPDGVLNKRKVEIVNRLLRDIYGIVEGEPTRAYLDHLDEDDLPQNSDVVLILSQAVAAITTFRKKYYRVVPEVRRQTWATTQLRDKLKRRTREDEASR